MTDDVTHNAAAIHNEYSMQRGHELLQAGDAQEAIFHFTALSRISPPLTKQMAAAAQMAGVTHRLLGHFEDALEYLDMASERAGEFDDPCLTVAVERDLATTLHVVGIRTKNQEMLDEARRIFDYCVSPLHFRQQIRSLDPDDSAQFNAEIVVTKGCQGMLLYETGEKEDGRKLIFFADLELREFGPKYEIYQLNNLVRLMRVSRFLDRTKYLNRALELTSKTSQSSGSRNRVWAALFGNRAYRFLETPTK